MSANAFFLACFLACLLVVLFCHQRFAKWGETTESKIRWWGLCVNPEKMLSPTQLGQVTAVTAVTPTTKVHPGATVGNARFAQPPLSCAASSPSQQRSRSRSFRRPNLHQASASSMWLSQITACNSACHARARSRGRGRGPTARPAADMPLITCTHSMTEADTPCSPQVPAPP